MAEDGVLWVVEYTVRGGTRWLRHSEHDDEGEALVKLERMKRMLPQDQWRLSRYTRTPEADHG